MGAPETTELPIFRLTTDDASAPVSPAADTASSTSDKHSIKTSFEIQQQQQPPPSRSLRLRTGWLTTPYVIDAFWAALQLIVPIALLVLLCYCMWEVETPLMTVEQKTGGTAQFQMTMTSCRGRLSQDDDWIMGTSHSIPLKCDNVLEQIAHTIPGYAVFQIRSHSYQSQVIFLTALVTYLVSFFLNLLGWLLVYVHKILFPYSWREKAVRPLYLASFCLAFAGFAILLSIGIGYNRYLWSSAYFFNVYVQRSMMRGDAGEYWLAAFLEDNYQPVWVTIAFGSLVPFGLYCALHNRVDARARGTADNW